MTKKRDRLEYGEYIDCGVLPDGSHICVRRGESQLGEYEVVRGVLGDNRRMQILESGFITLIAAKEYAWKVWGSLTGKQVKIGRR